MFYSSAAVLVLSASAVVSPLSNLLHLHPHVPAPDTRILVALYNPSPTFREIRIDGRCYTLWSHHGLTVKAPAGTVIYADSRMYNYKPGDIVATVEPALAGHHIALQ